MARATDPILARSAATHIVTTLRDAGHLAYFAGGCVRDELLNLAPTDYDVATDATPDRVARLFDRTMHVGAAFGVVLVPLPAATVEVATFRSDGPYSDARRPDRIHFSDPVSDAQRRDFTINALFLDPLAPSDHPGVAGKVIDYVGGLQDLHSRVVRAVGDPERRLAEDHLRALRAVRFAARLNFDLDPATGAAITRHAGDLRGVSRERIGEEIRRMLLHPTRAAAVTLLQSLGLDAPALDSAHFNGPLPTLARLDGSPPSPPYPTCLAAWALDRGEDHAPSTSRSRRSRSQIEGVPGRWRAALKLSNEERDAVASILDVYTCFREEWTTLSVARQKRLAASTWCGESRRLLRVREPLRAAEIDARIRALEQSPSGIAPAALVTGDDLVAEGIQPSPTFKRVLDLVYDAQLEDRVSTKAQAMELAKGLCV